MNVACDYEAPMQMLTTEKYIAAHTATQRGTSLGLRIDWPMCNGCSHGTLLHDLALKALTWVFATTTKTCAWMW